MARYGITTKKAFGTPAPFIRSLAKNIGKDHDLALELWKTGVLEARGLASLIDEPAKVTKSQMQRWVKDFDNWAVCDSCCGNLFDKTPHAYSLAVRWSRDGREFVKRAGFSMMAELAVHDKKAPDEKFQTFLRHIRRGAADERNFVKKGVNWALRQIGKRNPRLHAKAVATARNIRRLRSGSARWVANDALRELLNPAVMRRIKARNAAR